MHRYEIDTDESKYHVKDAFIELILRKTIQEKWESLEPQQNLQTKKKNDDKAPSNAKTPTKKGQQLLGGKSTPLTKTGGDDKNQDSEVKVDNSSSNLPGSSKSSAVDKRNIQKTVSQSHHPDSSNAGLTGLENYANNCYMNVVIQLLANIQELRDYLKS